MTSNWHVAYFQTVKYPPIELLKLTEHTIHKLYQVTAINEELVYKTLCFVLRLMDKTH